MIGKTLGHYEIIEPLGAGGMGEVYRARDPRLDRDVAIKLLPEDFSADAERLARFEREAKLLAQLNHTNIAGIYGLEDADGVRFIAMECVDGETLAERLAAQGRIEVDEALHIARQIAEALEAAHESGVIHRDLKPANVIVTAGGKVKVLDFGLAKVNVPGSSRSDPSPDLSHSPTMAAATQAGLILGTAAYMSPEQARGKNVDRRTDVWAFGCVLYEMLTGYGAFAGNDVTEVLASVVKSEPDWNRLPAAVPPDLRRLLRRCLEKDSSRRLDSMAVARLDVDDGLAFSPTSVAASGDSLARSWLPWLVTAVSLAFAALSQYGGTSGGPTPTPRFLPLDPAPGVTLFSDFDMPLVTISHDGRLLAYVGDSSGERRLFLKNLESPEPARALEGTEGARAPFFSPDDEWLAFAAGNWLQIVSVNGGQPRQITPSRLFAGGTFSPDGEMIYYTPNVDAGIWRIPVAGGTPQQITEPRRDGFDNTHKYPHFLPDGRLLYTSAYGRFRLVVHDLDSDEETVILENETALYGRYARSGHVVFAQLTGVMAATLDLDTLEAGAPVEVLPDAVVGTQSQADFAFSDDGTLVFLEGDSAYERTLVRFDRDGGQRVLDTNGPQPLVLAMSFAPDERLAVSLGRGGQYDIFVYDLPRQDPSPSRLITEPHNDFSPVWSRKGDRIAFTSVRSGYLDLYVADANRPNDGTLLFADEESTWPNSWSKDDRFLAFTRNNPDGRADIWAYDFDTEGARPIVHDPEHEDFAAFSPVGDWIAFEKGDLLRDVYVRPFPGDGPECKVSNGGGNEPQWSADGTELFYRKGSTALVADVGEAIGSDPADRAFCRAESTALFDGLEEKMWAVSPSGGYFVTVEKRRVPRLWLVQDWFEALKAQVPTGG